MEYLERRGNGPGSPDRSEFRTVGPDRVANPVHAAPPPRRLASPAWRRMSGTARYAAILRAPHVTPLLLASMLARLPYGVYALAVILYLSAGARLLRGRRPGRRRVRASAPPSACRGQGRLIDRFGQRRVLVPAALLDATATVALIALTESGAPTAALVVCGLLGGVAIPSVGGALRALWPSLLGGRGGPHRRGVRARLGRARGPLHLRPAARGARRGRGLAGRRARPQRRLHRGRDAAVRRPGAVARLAARPRGRAAARRARRAALERRAHARLRRDPRRLRLRHRRDQPARVRRGARQHRARRRPARHVVGRQRGRRARSTARARWPAPLGSIYLVLSVAAPARLPPRPARRLDRHDGRARGHRGPLHRAAGGRRATS